MTEEIETSDEAPEVDDASTDEPSEVEPDAEPDRDEPDAEPDRDEPDADESESLDHGDFIRLAYTARSVENGQLVDTTDEELAEEEDIDTSQQEFRPQVVILGEGHLFRPVEDDIVGKTVGDTGQVVVPAEDAFGEHDPDAVRTVSVDKIHEDERYPGAHVHVDGEAGHVETVIGGRARVDFNHPLAGQDVEYEYEILEAVEDRIERAKGLFWIYLEVEPELWFQTDEVEEERTVMPDEEDLDGDGDEDGDEAPEPRIETEVVEVETLYVESTAVLERNQQWMFSKREIANDVMEHLDLDRVIIQEVIHRQPAPGGMPGDDLGQAFEDADVDAEELIEEIEGELGEEAAEVVEESDTDTAGSAVDEDNEQ